MRDWIENIGRYDQVDSLIITLADTALDTASDMCKCAHRGYCRVCIARSRFEPMCRDLLVLYGWQEDKWSENTNTQHKRAWALLNTLNETAQDFGCTTECGEDVCAMFGKIGTVAAHLLARVSGGAHLTMPMGPEISE